MAATVTAQVTCPMHAGSDGPLSCQDELVTVDFGSFASTQAKVAPCSSLIAQGWVGPQWVGSKSHADRLLPQQTVLQHRDGLVTFAV